MNPISVLVTGAAGDIGRSVAKVLRDLPYVDRVLGVDLSDRFPTHAFFDEFETAARVDDPNYLTWLGETATRLGADVIIPMSEPELRFLNEAGLSQVGNIRLLMASHDAMDIGFDKLATADFLRDANLPYPWTRPADTAKPLEFPCIRKSRTGAGSKDVSKLTAERYLEDTSPREGMIYQELLLPDDQEYTCGLYRSRDGQVASITLHRWLVGDRTGYAQVVNNEDIVALLETLAAKLAFTGSINVQLRLTDRGPVVFEINPRFSSTVRFRDLLGFHDLDWSLRDLFGELGTLTWAPEAAEGKQIFRSDTEIIY